MVIYPLVWQEFSALSEYEPWNSVCQDYCLVEGQEMTQAFSFSFKPPRFHLPRKITPTITSCEPRRGDSRADFFSYQDRRIFPKTQKGR